MSARMARPIAGFLGDFRYNTSDARKIRTLAGDYLNAPVLGAVTVAARWYLLEKKAPPPLPAGTVTRELEKLASVCDALCEQIGQLSEEARHALRMQAMVRKSAGDTIPRTFNLAFQLASEADDAADAMKSEHQVTRYRPRDVDRAFRNRLTQLWVERDGPLLPFSRDLGREGEPFRGPLADFLRACMEPLTDGRDLENLFEELRRAKARR
jgi:hypothetical protein